MRRLHSLSGVVPVGAFFVMHLWTNARALGGQQGYDERVAELQAIPQLLPIEIFVIWLPLAFHALYGLRLGLGGRPNVGRYPYSRNWAWLLQRATGVIVLAFLGWHLWQFRIQVALGRMAPADLFPDLCAKLSHTTRFGIPLVAVGYLVGLAAAAFHLANGLWGFCFSWGITVSRAASRTASVVFGIFGVLLFLLGANTVVYFATGSRLVFTSPRPDADAIATCRHVPGAATLAATGGKQAALTGPTP